ncbi:MAG TPA: YceI family protein [Myxococcota bacterium]
MIVPLLLSLAAAPTPFNFVAGEVDFEIEAPLDTISGVTRTISGSATIDPAAWTVNPQAKIDVDLMTFSTGISLRDEDLRDQFFESSKFGKATLTITALERASAPALVEGTPGEAVASGTLSLHGVDKAVKIPIKATIEPTPSGQRVVVTGDFVVPILDHKIKRPQRLVFKLGTDVKVHFRAAFRTPPANPSAPQPPPTVADLEAAAPPPPPVVARPAAPQKPKFQFADSTPEGKGERDFVSAKIGGDKNALTCKSCHATTDERSGIKIDGVVKPSSTMWDAAQRATLWQGIATSPGHAADICAKLFMRKDAGLDAPVRANLEAYLKKISPDPQPPLNYEAIHVTRRSTVADLDRGSVANGKKLTEVYCKSCHAKGSVRPELEPGLYEGDMIVKRVRRFPGADNQQMPLFTMNRLPDTELRDIVAYLVGTPDQRIFSRKRAAAAAPAPATPAPATPAPAPATPAPATPAPAPK